MQVEPREQRNNTTGCVQRAYECYLAQSSPQLRLEFSKRTLAVYDPSLRVAFVAAECEQKHPRFKNLSFLVNNDPGLDLSFGFRIMKIPGTLNCRETAYISGVYTIMRHFFNRRRKLMSKKVVCFLDALQEDDRLYYASRKSLLDGFLRFRRFETGHLEQEGTLSQKLLKIVIGLPLPKTCRTWEEIKVKPYVSLNSDAFRWDIDKELPLDATVVDSELHLKLRKISGIRPSLVWKGTVKYSLLLQGLLQVQRILLVKQDLLPYFVRIVERDICSSTALKPQRSFIPYTLTHFCAFLDLKTLQSIEEILYPEEMRKQRAIREYNETVTKKAFDSRKSPLWSAYLRGNFDVAAHVTKQIIWTRKRVAFFKQYSVGDRSRPEVEALRIIAIIDDLEEPPRNL